VAQPTRHFEAVEVGQHHVEDHEIGSVVLDGGERPAAGGRALDVESVDAEAHRQHLGDVLFVVDDEHERLRRRFAHDAGRYATGCVRSYRVTPPTVRAAKWLVTQVVIWVAVVVPAPPLPPPPAMPPPPPRPPPAMK